MACRQAEYMSFTYSVVYLCSVSMSMVVTMCYRERCAARDQPRRLGVSEETATTSPSRRRRPGSATHAVYWGPRPTAPKCLPLSWVDAQTERIGVGSAIFQIPARQPAITARDLEAAVKRLEGAGGKAPVR